MTTDATAETLLGRLALHYKLITREQLVEITTVQAVEGRPLGEMMVARGWISAGQLQQLLKAQQQMQAQQRTAAPAAGPAQGATTRALPSEPPAAPATLVAAAAPPPVAPASAPVASPASPVAAIAAPAAPVAPAVPVVPAAPRPAPPPSPAAVPSAAAAAATTPSEATQPAADSRGSSTWRREPIYAILESVVSQGASDIHFHGGASVRYRVNGQLREVGSQILEQSRMKKLLSPLINAEQLREVEERGQVDYSIAVPGMARFRVNAYRQQRGFDLVLRVISERPPTLEALGLPASFERFTHYHQGLVLVTGPAGCGKSSTLAALIEIINQQRPDHIITVEDPIEYVFASKKAVVNQRQVGRHTESFARALRAALREDPDVIAIGELRDLETISLALTAAETGHLVIATLHTPNTIRTINRILGVFPPEQQNQVRTMVSESLRAVVSQRLLPRADGTGRVAAVEVLLNTKAVGNLIREEKTFQIFSVLQTGASHGMNLLDGSLLQLVKSGVVTKEEARRHAEDPKPFA